MLSVLPIDSRTVSEISDDEFTVQIDTSAPRLLPTELTTSISAMKACLKKERSSSNSNRTKMVFVRIPASITLEGNTSPTFPEMIGGVVESLYFFKLLYPHRNGWNHGLYIGLTGYVNRRPIVSFVRQFVMWQTRGNPVDLIQVSPVKSHSLSVYDYIHSLYGSFHNLLIDVQTPRDLVCASINPTPRHKEIQQLAAAVKAESSQVLESMMTLPSFYKDTSLWRILSMDKDQFVSYMTSNSLQSIVMGVCKDAFCIAMQRLVRKQKPDDSLVHHTVQRSIVNRLNTENVFKRIQTLIQQYFGATHVHPHPFINLRETNLADLPPLDGFMFNPRFMISMLMVSRWFFKVCTQDRQSIQNNRTNLVLYGTTGAGKTLLLSVLSQFIPTYKFLQGGRFQNPDIIGAAMLYFDEMDTSQLTQNFYKSLFDYKQFVKIDFKNAHPSNVSEGIPSIVSTNDDLFVSIRGEDIRQAKYRNPYGSRPKESNRHSADAALRRLYIVPMQFGVFHKMHGVLHEDDCIGETRKGIYKCVSQYNDTFLEQPDLLGKMFNLIFCLGCTNMDIRTFAFPSYLSGYLSQTLDKFQTTLWYSFISQHGPAIQDMLLQIEAMMESPDLSNTEYLKLYYESCVKIEIKQQKYLRTLCKRADDPLISNHPLILADVKCPQPLKVMYCMKSTYIRDHTMRGDAKPLSEVINEHVVAFKLASVQEQYQLGEDGVPDDNLFLDVREEYDETEHVQSQLAESLNSFDDVFRIGTKRSHSHAFSYDADSESLSV